MKVRTHNTFQPLVVFVVHFCIVIATLCSAPSTSRCEETGHYGPGSSATFFDSMLTHPGWAVGHFFTYYYGDLTTQQPYQTAITQSVSDGFGLTYQFAVPCINAQYAVAVAVGWTWLREATYTEKVGKTLTNLVYQTKVGFSDMTFNPIMIGWNDFDGDLKYDFRLGVYAPTGEFNKNDITAIGANFWTFEPMVTVSWTETKSRIEMSMYVGIDFNTYDYATDYQTGAQFHADGSLTRHVNCFGGYFGIGINGFYYQEVQSDSGPGATFGAYLGRTIGMGPTVSYTRKLGKKSFGGIEVKGLREISTKNRTQGNYAWVKLGYVF